MPDKAQGPKVRGDKFWRFLALIVLCGMVYYFSFDHGRQSVQARLEAERSSFLQQLSEQNRELNKVKTALAECLGEEAGVSGDQDSGSLSLRTGSSRILFENRLVVSLLSVSSLDNKANIQLNFLEDGQIVTGELGAGGNLNFKMDGQDWSLVLSKLQLASVNLTLVPLKTDKP